MTRPQIAVTDASLWFDLDLGGLIDAAFGVGVTWAAPDVVLREQSAEPTGSILLERGVLELDLSGAEMRRAFAFLVQHPGLCAAEAMALAAAAGRGLLLVTDDRCLRAVAERKGVRCRGVLWLLDRLLDQGVVGPRALAHALEAIAASWRRPLPEEVRARLRAWRSTAKGHTGGRNGITSNEAEREEWQHAPACRQSGRARTRQGAGNGLPASCRASQGFGGHSPGSTEERS